MSETWKPVPGFSGYEASTEGNFRSVDRVTPSGRRCKGQQLSTRVSNRGYVLVDLRDDAGKKVTRSAHTVVLETFAGPCPPGMEARHLDDVSTRNVWRPGTEDQSRGSGGNLFWGTKGDQHRDKVRNGGAKPPPGPSYDCVNHDRCKGKVKNEGRRCLPCVEQVGRDAAQMLNRGENLLKVAQQFGYSGTRWTYQLAVKHGGYAGTEAQALTQRRSWLRRVTATVRDRRRRGDAPSPKRPGTEGKGERNPRPRALRAVSPQQRIGQTGQPRTPSVAERDVPEVTPRDRPARSTGSITRRSR
jgi:hypothetical protein